MNSFLQILGPAIAAFLVQSAVVAGIALTVAALGSRRGAGFRIAIYRSTILAVLALVFVGPIVRALASPKWEISGSDSPAVVDRTGAAVSDSQVVDSALDHKTEGQAPGQPLVREDYQTAAPAPSTKKSLPIWDALALVWIVGFTCVLAGIAAGSIWVLRLGRSATALGNSRLQALLRDQSGRQRAGAIRLVSSPQVFSAFVSGIRKPTIYLPQAFANTFEADQIEAILCHEVVHVGQRDCAWALLARVSCALTWPSPFLWLVAREMTRASEELCDQLVLESGVKPATYAASLIRVAESISSVPNQRLVGTGVFSSKSQLSKRIAAMLNHQKSPTSRSGQSLRFTITGLAVMGAMAACLLVSASPLSFARRDSTPEATLRGLFDAFNKQDWRGVFSRIDGAKVDAAVENLNRVIKTETNFPKFLVHYGDFKTSGGISTVHIKIDFDEIGQSHGRTSNQDDVKMRWTGSDWKLVGSVDEGGITNSIVEVAHNPEMMAKARSAAAVTVLISNLKQIALGILMFANDHHDKLNLTQANLKASLKKYIINDGLWLGPQGQPLDIRFNAALSGKTIDSSVNPSNCVLLSLGQRGSLIYINERTPIAFADGHVKMIPRANVATLSWK